MAYLGLAQVAELARIDDLPTNLDRARSAVSAVDAQTAALPFDHLAQLASVHQRFAEVCKFAAQSTRSAAKDAASQSCATDDAAINKGLTAQLRKISPHKPMVL